ncbi:sensor histidine kinase [Nocardioides daphniae]|uniref:histidine kinase n=1 Tax=Nocardioides daphniae TaxID=402297 RepID=A0A4P7UG84_9ACTN|nr:HAMP domain-containing sensor histidine kinase [Nocardioides daphniae]QCC77769.1 HAMP domain-containing histidine kinase [Nocardioides daphniae]
MLDAGERMRDLVGSVSDLVDLEAAGHVTLASEDLTDVVRQCLDRVRQTLERPDVTVELHAPPESLDADIDGALLCRALTALLANAVQHSPPDATVRIDVVGTPAVVSVQVSDHGPGIAAAERARLVRPFERGSSDLTGPRARAGLPLAHAVALAHHGTLALRDNEPHGLVAVLMLPRRRPMSRG